MYPLQTIYAMLGAMALGAAAASNSTAPDSTDAKSGISKSRYGTIAFNTTGSIVRATINNPPINLVDARVSSDLFDFLSSINRTTSAYSASSSAPAPPKVVIFSSGNADFFMSHLDVNALLPPFTAAKQAFAQQFVTVGRLLQSLTATVFIAEINGNGWGAGQELPVQMDLRYAGPKARTGFVENALNAVAGVGGQLSLGPLVGRGRALEHTLAIEAFDGPNGTAAGLFNSYHPTATELRSRVDAVANRIAGRSTASINATKFSLARELGPTAAQLDQNVAIFNGLIEDERVQALVRKYLKASNNQTNVTFELGYPDTVLALSQSS